ncbi:MAG: 3-oxoacyl-ACP reductase [Acidobacteriota bacterium]
MRLGGRNAVIYGGSGAIGSAVAKAMAREGARVFLAGRTVARLERTASEIATDGGRALAVPVDARDEWAVEAHAEAIADSAGGIDVAVNAIGIPHVQGKPIAELTLAEFELPLHAYLRSVFLTSKAVARSMAARGGGAILTLSTPGSRMSGAGFLGYGTTCGAIETFTRVLAGELGPHGIRAVCLRADAIPEALEVSHAREVFRGFADRAGTTVEALLAERARGGTLLGRFPTLDQIGRTAAFLASDDAGAITGAVINATCGSVVD